MPDALRTFAALRSKFRWNEKAQRYTVGGRFVKDSEVRRAVGVVLNKAKAEARGLGARLAAGTISIPDFQLQMMEAVKTLHLLSASIARGGIHNLTPADFGRIGQRLRDNYRRLDNFAADVAADRMTPRQIEMRAGMYVGNARGQSYENEKREAMTEAGMEEERRILGDAEHCPDCIEAALLKWQPIGTLPEIGDTICISNCRCYFIYRHRPAEREN